jgi:hypothetical protein
MNLLKFNILVYTLVVVVPLEIKLDTNSNILEFTTHVGEVK